MPKRVSDKEFQAILRAVGRFPRGGSVVEIAAVINSTISRRTLQRRLVVLVEHSQIIAEGETKGRRYRLAEIHEPSRRNEDQAEREHDEIGLSPEAAELKEQVQASVTNRTPVGYKRTFLDSYQPNQTFYLPDSARRRLEAAGRKSSVTLPAGTYIRQVYNRLLIDLSWNSSRLEGNTYSLLETERLLEAGEHVEGKRAQETQMILNHKAAIELLVDQADEIGFNRYTISNLHALLSDNLLADPMAGGRLRSIPVGISESVFHPLEMPQLIDECFEQVLEKAEAIENAFEQALFIMVHLPYLQPFVDVNKRVSRLAANIPLIRKNYCPLSFVDVPKKDYTLGLLAVYELNRVEYLRDVFVWAYTRSCARFSAIRESLGEPDPFRLKYRSQIGEVVAEVVRKSMSQKKASSWIGRRSTKLVPAEDEPRFTEIIKMELKSLHEGNIARYRLTQAEYKAWKGSH